MSKEATTVITLLHAVSVTLDDGRQVTVPAGISSQPLEVANHWYVKGAFAPVEPPKLGSYEYAQAKIKRAKEAEEAFEALAQEADEALAAWRESQEGATPASEPAQQSEDQGGEDTAQGGQDATDGGEGDGGEQSSDTVTGGEAPKPAAPTRRARINK